MTSRPITSKVFTGLDGNGRRERFCGGERRNAANGVRQRQLRLAADGADTMHLEMMDSLRREQRSWVRSVAVT